MITLSLCMIVKNEEDVILRCLKSVEGLFDEIIIADTGSTDNTLNILKNENVKVYNYKWTNNFADARNFAFSKATSDYIMWLDADDVVEPDELKKLKQLKSDLTFSVSVVMLKYLVGVETSNPIIYYRERILKRAENFLWEDAVHEVITPRGNIVYKDIFITHKKTKPTTPMRNLKIYEQLVKNGVNLKPRQMFYYSRELYYNNKTKKAIVWFNKFLKTTNGFKENYIEACLNLSQCYTILNDKLKAKQSLINSFIYDTPRSELLCELGNIYFNEFDFSKAVYYYNLATLNKPDINSGGFVINDCYNYLPYLQLSVCYYKLNNFSLAKHFHLKAKELKPDSPQILFNEKFFGGAGAQPKSN